MNNRLLYLITCICMVLTLITLFAMFPQHLILGLWLLVWWGWYGLAMLVLSIHLPWFTRNDSESMKPSTPRTAAAMTMALMLEFPWSAVLSDRTFSILFNQSWTGFTLDQPTIYKCYFWFTFSSAVVLPFVVMARGLCARNTLLGYLIFVSPSSIMFLCLLCILALGIIMLLQYIDAMGITPKRVFGLIYGMCGYLGLLGFWYWAAWPPKKNDVSNPIPAGDLMLF